MDTTDREPPPVTVRERDRQRYVAHLDANEAARRFLRELCQQHGCDVEDVVGAA